MRDKNLRQREKKAGYHLHDDSPRNMEEILVKPPKHAGGPRKIENSLGSQDGYSKNGTTTTKIPNIDIIAHSRKVNKPINPYLRSTKSNKFGITKRV